MSAISEYGIEPANQAIKNRIDAAMVGLDILINENASSSVRRRDSMVTPVAIPMRCTPLQGIQ
ncbi:hypothetical protein ECJURUA2010_2529 [Escherichia coli Jurua 20/10]|nr:hypothetical protein ECJURUA2010_2529 [Escherichia coli Jurua 20/10]